MAQTITILRDKSSITEVDLKTFLEYVTNNTCRFSCEQFIKNRPQRYYSFDENGNKVIKKFDLLEWVLREVEASKFLLKEDFVEQLALEGIDVFTYQQDEFIWSDYRPADDHLKFLCILKAHEDFKSMNFFYSDKELEDAFGFSNVAQMIEEMVNEDLINVEVLEGHSDTRIIYITCL